MSLRIALVRSSLVVGFAALVACSSSSPDEIDPAPPRTPTAATPTPPADDEHDESEGGPAPSDDPGIGGETTDTPPPDAAPKGNDCVKGGLYCGGDKVTGDAKTLYKCEGPGAPTVVEKCANGCMVNSGTDDSCAAAAGARVTSPVPGKSVTYAYGVKNPRYAAGYHTGEDYATPTGSNAVAVRSGTIRWSNDNGGAYGKWIGLDADNGRTYVYCHLSSRVVAAGTKVTAGQLIAKTGATGNVTGPHLHFEDHPLGPFDYGQVRKPTW